MSISDEWKMMSGFYRQETTEKGAQEWESDGH